MKLRDREDNYNDLLEQQAMAKLLPDITGKDVLDLGCGYGRNCIDFVLKGAKRVVGVDISKKMLEIAKEKSSDARIEYIRMDMSEILTLQRRFDLIYSSLNVKHI